VVKFRVHLLFVLLLCALSFFGCSGNNPIVITLSPTTPPVINAGQTQAVTASLVNDIQNQGVTWSLSGPGSLTTYTSTSVTFVAPTGISIETTSTVTATSVANTTVTATLNITVNPVLAITTASLPVGSVGTSYVGVVGAVGAVGTFTWSLTKGNLPPGLSLSSSTSSSVTILGIPTTIGTSTFTLQVVDSAGASVSRTFGITINPPPALSITTHTLPPGMVGALYGGTSGGVALQASSGTQPYSWQLTGGTMLPAGLSLSTAGVISGTPTTVETSAFTVEVKDSSNPQQTANASLSITVNPSNAGNSQLSGDYAFQISGFESGKTYAAAGSFAADGNGNISNGLMDSNTPGSVLTSQAFTGTYAIGSNGLGTISLTGPGTPAFAVAMRADGNAQIIQYGTTTGSGVLLKQTAISQSQILGNYALGFMGSDASGNRYGFAGDFTANGSGTMSSANLDSDDNGTAAGPVAFTGTYSAPSQANGRGTLTITIPGQNPASYSYYAVSSTQLLVVEIDSVTGNIVSGQILQQQPGSFTNASLNGTSVLEATALASGATVAQAGLFVTTGGGNSTLTGEQNSGGTITTTSGSGSYTVSNVINGRVQLSGSGIASPDPVLYLVNTNQAFVVGADAAVTFGFLEPQTGGPFTPASLDGQYAGASTPAVASGATDQVDIAVGNGAGNLSFATDMTGGPTGLYENQDSSGGCSLGSTGQCTGSITGFLGPVTVYIFAVSPTEFYQLYSNSNVTLEHFQQ
jgi:hypothetical protein